MLVTPDLETILPGLVYNALKTKYPGLFTTRSAPSDVTSRPVVVLQYAGGGPRNKLLDDINVSVDVYATSEKQANDLSRDVRGVLDSLMGHSPIIEISTTVPVPITVDNRGPQRQFYAQVLTRKARA